MCYKSLIESIKKEFENNEEIYGILIYGSSSRGDFIPAFSDLDLMLVVNHNFVIPRKCYEKIGRSFGKLVEEYNIYIDAMICDKEILGTKFSTLGPIIRKHIKDIGEVILGKNVKELLSENYFIDKDIAKSEARGYIAWNLDSSRRNTVYLEYYKKHNGIKFEEVLKYSLKSLPSFIRNAVLLKTNKWIEDKNEVFELFKEEFKSLYFIDPDMGRRWYHLSEEEKVDLFFQSLNLREEIIKILAEDVEKKKSLSKI